MMKNVLIIHYNTPELTRAAIRSLRKATQGCHVVVFDNSDARPFCADGDDDVCIIDNTRGQVFDLQAWIDSFPDKAPSPENNWGSARHCKSVQVCFDILSEGFVLLDSDILVKQDITPFFDTRYAWVGRVKTHKSHYGITLPRVLPFICWVNVPMLKAHGVRYCNDKKMWSLSQRIPDKGYDTGCWFFEHCDRKGLPTHEVNINEYIIHLGHASWQPTAAREWLEEHKALWL